MSPQPSSEETCWTDEASAVLLVPEIVTSPLPSSEETSQTDETAAVQLVLETVTAPLPSLHKKAGPKILLQPIT